MPLGGWEGHVGDIKRDGEGGKRRKQVGKHGDKEMAGWLLNYRCINFHPNLYAATFDNSSLGIPYDLLNSTLPPPLDYNNEHEQGEHYY